MDIKPRYFSRNVLLVLIALFFFALLVRVQFVRTNIDHLTITRDAKQYVQYAHNLVQHSVFSKSTSEAGLQPDSFRSPGYPLLIALMMWMGGEQTYLPMLVYAQAAMSALLVPLTFAAGTFFLPFYGALIAAMLVAFSPHLITITGCLLTETLFSFFLLSSLCCFQFTLKKKLFGFFIASALLFGCTYLINETALLLPYLLFIVISLQKLSNKKLIFKKAVLFLVVFTIVPVGWSVRNHLNVPSESETGSDRAIVTMSHGAYPEFIFKNPRYKRFPYREDPMQPAFGESFESFVHILWTRVKKEPARYVKWYLFGKPYYLWNWDIIQGVGGVYIYPVKNNIFQDSILAGLIKSAMRILHPLLLMLSLVGIPLLYRESKILTNPNALLSTPFYPFSVCIYFTLLYTVFAPWPRYSIPLRPELYLFSTWCLVSIINMVRKIGIGPR